MAKADGGATALASAKMSVGTPQYDCSTATVVDTSGKVFEYDLPATNQAVHVLFSSAREYVSEPVEGCV